MKLVEEWADMTSQLSVHFMQFMQRTHTISVSFSKENMGRPYSTHGGGDKNVCKTLVGKSEGKRTFGRPRCTWEDNIRMDLKEMGWKGVDWMNLVQDRGQIWLVNTVKKFRVL